MLGKKKLKPSLENILRYLPGNVYWVDRSNLIVWCNDEQAKSLGANSPEEVIGRKLNDFVTGESASAIEANNDRVMCSGESLTMEEEAIYPNQTKKHYLSQKVPLKDGNEVIGLLGISFDITKRKQQEQRLLQEKKDAELEATTKNVYLENILSHLPEHFYWVDTESRVLGCNDKQAKVFGFESANELIGKTIYDVAEKMGWDKSIPDTVRKNDLKVMETAQSMVSEEIAFLDNKQKTFLSYKNPLIDNNGKIIGVFGVTVDITARKEAEEMLKQAKEKAEAASKSKTEFIANMSHDLRTPFNGILGLSQYLASKEIEPEKKELLEEIHKSASQLFALLNEILDMANIENADQEMKAATFDLYETMNAIKAAFASEAIRKGIDFIVHFDSTVPQYVKGDKLKLHRIILNLVGNAMKFTHEGFVAIKLSAEPCGDKSNLVTFIVQDSGIGIPKDKFQVIFERFSRLTTSHSSHYAGTGLGLYIVSKFVQDIGGTITVESELNKGSIFKCQIKLDETDI